jgi:hypothetical protein
MTAERSEANIFTVNPAGVKVHWKLVEGTPSEELKKLVVNVGVLTAALAEKGYTPDPMGGKYGPSGPVASSGASQPTAAPNDAGSPAPRCPDCGGEVYDNRGNRPSPKSPHFKCKNKACASVGWEGTDGISWQKARQPANSGQRY